jgi:AcrR family transcriptional regulator
MAAATRVIVTHGLSASTAMIAQEAAISNGSLFTYFKTKADLFNQLYLELKASMASAALDGLPAKAELREQFFHIWSNWMHWAVSNPENPAGDPRSGPQDDGKDRRAYGAVSLERSDARRPDGVRLRDHELHG